MQKSENHNSLNLESPFCKKKTNQGMQKEQKKEPKPIKEGISPILDDCKNENLNQEDLFSKEEKDFYGIFPFTTLLSDCKEQKETKSFVKDEKFHFNKKDSTNIRKRSSFDFKFGKSF